MFFEYRDIWGIPDVVELARAELFDLRKAAKKHRSSQGKDEEFEKLWKQIGQPGATLIGTIGFFIVLVYFVTKPPFVISIGLDMSGVIFLLFSAFCSLTVLFSW